MRSLVADSAITLLASILVLIDGHTASSDAGVGFAGVS
jgi:hypothetical protein